MNQGDTLQNAYDLRAALAREIGDLVESIVRRTPPYDAWVFPPIISEDVRKYYQYLTEIPVSIGMPYIDGHVAFLRHLVNERVLGYSRSFAAAFPEQNLAYEAASRALRSWLQVKESRSLRDLRIVGISQERVRVPQIAKKLFRQRLPAFTPDGKWFGTTGFSKPFNSSCKIHISIDRGSRRQMLQIGMGCTEPLCLFDIGFFFGGATDTLLTMRET